ncbi:MAG: PAS domain-containing protein, partial [Betaproteobacteria bacterium]|nr:PAS domain-containing protein [Betaproteobacteria bacterium]
MNPPKPRSQYLLVFSFGLLLLVLTVLMALGMTRIESFNSQLNEVTDSQSRDIGTISELFLSNGRRVAAIDGMFAATTPEERAAVHAQYRVTIEIYNHAVARLRELPVSAASRAARDDAIKAAARAQNVGEEVAQFLLRGQIAPASELNLTQAVLTDSRLQETLYRLLEANHSATAQAVAIANQGMRNGFLLIGAGGLFALLAGAVIALLVIRVVASTEANLEREIELAEVTLHSIVDGVITTDTSGRVDYLNPVAERYLGWTTQDAHGKPLGEVYRVIGE